MKTYILGTTALALAFSPFNAFAQSQNTPTSDEVSSVDEIVVTGTYRRSLQQAVDIKRVLSV